MLLDQLLELLGTLLDLFGRLLVAQVLADKMFEGGDGKSLYEFRLVEVVKRLASDAHVGTTTLGVGLFAGPVGGGVLSTLALLYRSIVLSPLAL